MPQHRLNFFLDDNPVGHFRTRGYPTSAGRYRYSPYRGIGHSRLKQILEKGRAANCWYSRRGQKVQITVVSEEFVPKRRHCQWFVNIYAVEFA